MRARRSSYMADCVRSGSGNSTGVAGTGSGCAGAAGFLFFFLGFAGAFFFPRLAGFFAFFLAGIVASLGQS